MADFLGFGAVALAVKTGDSAKGNLRTKIELSFSWENHGGSSSHKLDDTGGYPAW